MPFLVLISIRFLHHKTCILLVQICQSFKIFHSVHILTDTQTHTQIIHTHTHTEIIWCGGQHSLSSSFRYVNYLSVKYSILTITATFIQSISVHSMRTWFLLISEVEWPPIVSSQHLVNTQRVFDTLVVHMDLGECSLIMRQDEVVRNRHFFSTSENL